jgi:hypothetical protein
MRTNRNIFSKLSKATFIIALTFTTLISVSCQNAARQSFHYKTDFIKQMVSQVSNEFMSRTGLSAQYSNNNTEFSSKTENTLHFLTEAAQINSPVTEMETENDNTLDFLTSAAQLNTEVAQENNSDETLDLLITAAQFNAPVVNEEICQDELLGFLTQAANLNTSVVE